MSDATVQAARSARRDRCRYSSLALAVGSLVCLPSAHAQLEEVIVTAQKREQAITDIPMSITALSAKDMAREGVELVQDFAKSVPGFNYAESRVGTPIYTLRGVGFNDIALGGRPTVSIYQDEVPIPFAIETRGGFLDLERTEILMGPQGTLFGQNSTGGAINLVAAKPQDSFDAGLELGYANFNKYTVGGFLTGPLTDDLNYRVAIRRIDSDPWQESYIDNSEVATDDLTSWRVLLDWSPSDTVAVALNLNGFNDESEMQAPQLSGFFPGIPDVAPFIPELQNTPLPPEDNTAAHFTPDDYARDNKFWQVNLRIEFDLNEDFTLTSLTSFSEYDQDQVADVDGMGILGLQQRTLGEIESVFQELRVGGNLNQNIYLTAGVNYASDETREFNIDDISQSTLGVGTGLATFNLQNNQDIETWAAFGNLEISFADVFTAHLGLRYTDSEIDFEGCTLDSGDGAASGFVENILMLPAPGVGNCITFDPTTFMSGLVTNTLSEDNISWRVALDWQATDEILAYGAISRGYKAGGFPTLAATLTPQYDATVEEELTAYEVGIKGTLSESLQLNAALFYYDYIDKQVLGFTNDPVFGPLLRLNNVPESEVLGAEVQLVWYPTDKFEIKASGSFLSSEVTGDFISEDPFATPTNFRGESFPNAPDTQVSATATYRWSLNESLEVHVGASANYQSDTNSEFGEAPELDVDSFSLFDLRLGLDSTDGRWSVGAYVRNLTDEYYWTTASKTNDTFIRYTGRPRTYGVSFTYRLSE
ncbi:MAG: TonB-dependent receptor [Pseudomonadota bacterium]